jgi:hypothetical protein
MADKRSCFVVSPIGSDGSEIRQRSDNVFEFILVPILEPKGFDVIRADHMNSPGSITAQVIEAVINSDLVVADLTGHNPNVFYELALRHAVLKPYIQLADQKSLPPFDIRDERTIVFDVQDLRSVEKCKINLAKQVDTVMAEGFKVSTPIGKAIQLRTAKQEGGTEAIILERLEAIERLVTKPRKATVVVSDPGSTQTFNMSPKLVDAVISATRDMPKDRASRLLTDALAAQLVDFTWPPTNSEEEE